MSSLHEFATWKPLLRLLWESDAERLAAPGAHVSGHIGFHGWSVPVRRPRPRPGRAAQAEDMREEFDAVARVRDALAEAGVEDISFVAETSSAGGIALHVVERGAAVESGIGSAFPGSLLLVEDAVAEPWRRLPDPAPGVKPASSADAELLERTLRAALPGSIGATDAEIAATEARLGVALPEELRALYRVVRGRWEDLRGDVEAMDRVAVAVGCELLPLDEIYLAEAARRPCSWRFAALEAVATPPDAAVQGLVGSPGWIAFGDNGGGDRIAIDLTPGPRGHLGQIIMLDHEQNIGADLIADSLTDLVLKRRRETRRDRDGRQPSPVARVNIRGVSSVEAAAHPGLEVLSLGVWEGKPLSLAPAVGLPRLRTLTAYPGTLADPLEIAELTRLEFLGLAPQDWRVLLDAGAVPRSLLAAAVEVRREHHPLSVVEVANELLGLWGRPPITITVVEGELGRVP
ncbi:SMI1/KNR4 family protein [Saccharomonospora xinjiangensis]|uniref:SMI1/KNR4 family protein n=1 Tax=Saccharomonospora xinjiangensis TaxID=75294 RepID=UPI00350F9569